MAESADLLFELGTEELPPVALKKLSEALTASFVTGLERAGLAHGAVTPYATPRRLALLVEGCSLSQPDLRLSDVVLQYRRLRQGGHATRRHRALPAPAVPSPANLGAG